MIPNAIRLKSTKNIFYFNEIYPFHLPSYIVSKMKRKKTWEELMNCREVYLRRPELVSLQTGNAAIHLSFEFVMIFFLYKERERERPLLPKLRKYFAAF